MIEWGQTSQNWPAASIRKSFLSALFGIYIDKAVINIQSTLGELGIDDYNPTLSDLERKARIVDLLKSCSGVYHPAAAEAPGMKKIGPKEGAILLVHSGFTIIGILGRYGYMWWSALNGEHFPFLKFPDGTYSARGRGEQVILIIPGRNPVIVHRTNVLKRQERYMKVTEFARILKRILEAKIDNIY